MLANQFAATTVLRHPLQPLHISFISRSLPTKQIDEIWADLFHGLENGTGRLSKGWKTGPFQAAIIL